MPDEPDVSPHAWMLPWLRVNLLLCDMVHVVSNDRSRRPVLKVELNKAIAMREKLRRAACWS